MIAVLHGKGSKTRHVPVTTPTAVLVADYLERRVAHPGLPPDADPLFPGPGHARLTRWAVTKLLDRHVDAIRAEQPGYAPGLTLIPHAIRRTRAMHLIEADVNLISIRDLLGHAHASTTEIYAKADTEAKRHAIEQAYQTLNPTTLPDWTQDTTLIGWLDTLSQ